MASTSETGHAKNVANFEDLISFCKGYGAAYKPSKPSILIAALETKHAGAKNSLSDLSIQKAASTNAVNAREIVFTPLNTLVTRIGSAVAASDVSKQVMNDVKTITRKLIGKRATPKKDTVPDDPSTTANESSKTNSVSQLSFDSRIENLDKLLQLLRAQAGYAPNEPELSVAGLTTLRNEMVAANTAAVNTATLASNARISRNKILYDPETGLVRIANDVKAYVKSAFGALNPQYKQVSKLKFNIPRL